MTRATGERRERGVEAAIVEDGGWMPRASCRSSVIAAFVDMCASATSALAASGSVSIFCWASPSVIPTETSRGWTPSWRSRSMRVRSTSAARTAPSRWTFEVRAASASCASRDGTMMARARTPCRMPSPTIAGEGDECGEHTHAARPGERDGDVGAGERDGASGRRAARTPVRSPKPRCRRGSTTIQPRMVAIARFATARQLPGSMACSPSVRRNPPNPGRAAGAQPRRGKPEVVQAVDACGLEPAEPEDGVDEADEEQEADAEDRNEADADTEQGRQEGEDEGPTTPSAASCAIAPATRHGAKRVERRSAVAGAAAGCVRVWEVMPPRYGRGSRSAPRSSRLLVSGYPESGTRAPTVIERILVSVDWAGLARPRSADPASAHRHELASGQFDAQTAGVNPGQRLDGHPPRVDHVDLDSPSGSRTLRKRGRLNPK